MRVFQLKVWILLALSPLVFPTLGCSPVGVDDPVTAEIIESTRTGVSSNFLKMYCENSEYCGISDYKLCQKRFLSIPWIDQEVGLPEGEFTNFKEIILAESTERISPNRAVATQCTLELYALSCEDMENTVTENGIQESTLTALIPPICNQLYQ